MKTILFHANEDAGQETRFQAALSLARTLRAHIKCCYVTSYMMMAPADGFTAVLAAEAVAQMAEQAEQLAKSIQAKMEARLAHEDVPWDWHNLYGDPAQCLAQQSRLADLTILSLSGEKLGRRGPLPLIGDVTISSTTPVLALPVDSLTFNPGGTVLIGWNGSDEAARAVRQSVRLLSMAGRVMVLTLGEEAEWGPCTQDVATYLSRYDIRVEMQTGAMGDDVALSLLAAASQVEAAYVVMGAYGHSRAREFLLGGATRSALSNATIPLVLCH